MTPPLIISEEFPLVGAERAQTECSSFPDKVFPGRSAGEQLVTI